MWTKKSLLITTALLSSTFPLAVTASEVKGEFDQGYFKFATDDGNFKWKFDGRIMLDSKSISKYEGERLISTNTDFRRARFAIKTQFYQDWAGEFDIDFKDNKTKVKDMWISYSPFENGTIKVGNHKPFFSMAELTTSRWYPLMETSSISDFTAPGRRIGASFSYWQPDYFVGMTVFGEELSANDNKEDLVEDALLDELIDEGSLSEEEVEEISEDTEKYAVAGERTSYAARAVYRPFRNAATTRFLHLGANYMVDHPFAEDQDIWRFKGEVHDIAFIKGDKYKPSKDLRVDDITSTSLELAARWDKFYFQSEFINNKVSFADNSVKDFDISGYYAEASYFIFGDGRPYNLDDGEFGPVVPVGKSQLEAIVRYDTFDANDKNIINKSGEYEQFGKLTNLTLGLNWYVNPNIVIRFNHSINDTDENADIKNADIKVTAARLEFLF